MADLPPNARVDFEGDEVVILFDSGTTMRFGRLDKVVKITSNPPSPSWVREAFVRSKELQEQAFFFDPCRWFDLPDYVPVEYAFSSTASHTGSNEQAGLQAIQGKTNELLTQGVFRASRGESVLFLGNTTSHLAAMLDRISELKEEEPSAGKRIFGAAMVPWAWPNRKRFKRSQRKHKR